MNEDVTAAKEALAADKQARARACAEALQAVLREHRCRLSPSPMLSPDGRGHWLVTAALDVEAED